MGIAGMAEFLRGNIRERTRRRKSADRRALGIIYLQEMIPVAMMIDQPQKPCALVHRSSAGFRPST